MKQSPDPQEPRQEGPGSSESHTHSGSDAEILRGEEQLLAALGREAGFSAGSDDGPHGEVVGDELGREPRSEFRDRLRAQFLQAHVAPESVAESVAESIPGPAAGASQDHALDKLRSWNPEPARPEFQETLRASFLAGAKVEPRQQAGSNARSGRSAHGQPQRRPRRAAAPAPARGTRFRWVATGAVLAAAAAVLLFLQRPSDVPGGPGTVPAPGAQVAQGSGDGERESGGKTSDPKAVQEAVHGGWELDAEFGVESELLAALRVDGESVESMDDFRSRMASAQRVESVGREVRILHKKEFVLEMASDSVLHIDGWADRGKPGGQQKILVESGGLRVATGPDFDRNSPLVVETRDVRTEITGTIFGVDVGADYTCVCCLEGSVATTPLNGVHPDCMVGRESTRVVYTAKASEPLELDLVPGHRPPLERLVGYWA